MRARCWRWCASPDCVSHTPSRPAGTAPSATFGPVSVYFGAKSGKVPDGNQVIVRGRDTTVAFDTPQVANRIDAVLDEVDRVIVGRGCAPTG